MAKLGYKCIACGTKFAEIEVGEKGEGISGGLCMACLIKGLVRIYRKRQKKEGNPDCFAKSSGFCDQINCKYRELCLSPLKPPVAEIECFLTATESMVCHA